MEPARLLDKITDWAKNNRVTGLALIGSYARDEARADSDIDLILLTPDPQAYIRHSDWIKSFGRVKSYQVEDWGLVTSLRAFYEDGLEVEFGLASPEWAKIPLDPGTSEVISGGMQILFDREGLLDRALSDVTRNH